MSDAAYAKAKEEFDTKKNELLEVAKKHMSHGEYEEFSAYMNVVSERVLSKYKVQFAC